MSTIHAPATRPARTSFLIYLGLLAFLVAVELLLTFAPVSFVTPLQAAAFTWPTLVVVGVAGLIGLFLSARTGFPEWWDAPIPATRRLLLPAGIGLAVGVLFLAMDRLTGFERIALASSGQAINVPFPASLFFYPAGAIITEILYRLAPLPFLLWLVANLVLRHRFERQVFWVLAVLVSLLEPASQAGLLQGSAVVMALVLPAIFAVNLLEVWLFRTCGFLAPLALRLAYYLVWHIIGGALPA